MNKQPKDPKPIYPVMEIPIREFTQPDQKKEKIKLKEPVRSKKPKQGFNSKWELVII